MLYVFLSVDLVGKTVSLESVKAELECTFISEQIDLQGLNLQEI